MDEKKNMVDIEKFKEFKNKKDLVQLTAENDIESFVIVTPKKEKMFLIVDFNQKILYPLYCGVRRDDGSAFKD